MEERYLICRNCKEDAYEQNLHQGLEYIKTRRSIRLNNLIRHSQGNQYELELKRLEDFSKLFQLRVCAKATFHLWKDNKKVLMVKQAYQFVNQLHGYEHLNGNEMINKIRGCSVLEISPLLQFIQEFQSFCNYCLLMKPINGPKTKNSKMWKVLQYKFGLSLDFLKSQESAEEICIKLDAYKCQNGQCTRDQYDRENQICLYFLQNGRLPALPQGEGSGPNRIRLQRKSQYMKIVQCQYGTDHLWMKEPEMLITMVNESKALAQLLHGEMAHRNKKMMRQFLLNYQRKIYPHGLNDSFDEVVAACLVCNRKSADIEDKINQQEEVVAHEHGTVKEKKKVKLPFGRMGLEMKKQYTRQLMEKALHREKVIKVRQIINGMEIWQNISTYLPRITAATGFFEVAAELSIDNYHWSRTDDDLLPQAVSRVKGIIFRAVKEGKTTKAMFICTDIMKCNYFRYGETINIDYVTGVIRRREASGRHFIVGFITGQDHCGNLVIFGITMLSKELSMYHLKSLQLFYDVMGKQSLPKLICIPDSKPLIMSLQIFRQQKGLQFEYAINWFYVLQFLKKNSHQQLQKSTILQLFCLAMSEALPPVYQQIMMRIKSQIVNTGIYRQIEKLGEMFCLSRLSRQFVGYGLSTFRIDQLYQLLEKQLVYQLKIGTFFSNVFQIDKKICDERVTQLNAYQLMELSVDKIKELLVALENEHRKAEAQLKQANKFAQTPKFQISQSIQLTQMQMSQISNLLHISQMLHPNIFRQVLKNYYLSLSQFLTCTADCPYNTKLIIKENKDKNKCVFYCAFFPAHSCWKCNCETIYQTGLPCPHLILVLARTKGSLQYYINSRWILNKTTEPFMTYEVTKIQPKIEDRISDHISNESKSVKVKILEQSEESKEHHLGSQPVPESIYQSYSHFDSFKIVDRCNSAILEKAKIGTNSEVSMNKSFASNQIGIQRPSKPPRDINELLKMEVDKIKMMQANSISSKQTKKKRQRREAPQMINEQSEFISGRPEKSQIVNCESQSNFSHLTQNKISYNEGNLYQWNLEGKDSQQMQKTDQKYDHGEARVSIYEENIEKIDEARRKQYENAQVKIQKYRYQDEQYDKFDQL